MRLWCLKFFLPWTGDVAGQVPFSSRFYVFFKNESMEMIRKNDADNQLL